MTKSGPVNLYASQMEEVKKRIAIVTHFLRSPEQALYFQPAIECAALQIRKILERIAFGSLIANQRLYEQTYSSFSKTWKADLLLKDLSRINPNYYPIPIKPRPTIKENGVIEHELVADGYLTPEEFQVAYETCNALLHATNPYRNERNMEDMAQKLMRWRNLIVHLLNIHEIHFVNQESIWIINMQEDGDEHVHVHLLEREDNLN